MNQRALVTDQTGTPSTQRLLVPLDGSSLAELALPEAADLSRFHTEVILLQVVPPIDDVITVGREEVSLNQQWDRQREHALRYLHAVSERPDWHGVPVRTAVEVGRPADVILAFAERHKIDRIVMTTHGRTGLGKCVLGSVADEVLHGAGMTVVLICPPGAGAPA